MSKAKNLGAGASFAQARPISARRAAIGAATAVPTAGVPDPTELPLDLISQNPDNPREELLNLEGLADSIREIGLINAITVASIDAYVKERPDRADSLDPGARYIVIDGHRRLEAARRAGASTIKVSVDNALVATDESLLEAAFVANVHRDDMNPVEEAHALRKLVDFYGSQNKAAKRLGIAQSTISSKLSILDLDPKLQADLLAGRRKVEHVRNLSKLSPEEQHRQADARAAAAAARRRDSPSELSRRDSSEEQRSTGEQQAPASLSAETAPAGADLSRRDSSEEQRSTGEQQAPAFSSPQSAPAETDLSRRDNPASQAERRWEELPSPREPEPSNSSGVADRPPILAGNKMPWHNGDEVADIVLQKMQPPQLERLLQRLIEAQQSAWPSTTEV
ncbi:ParB/RepB/Spo0J family partition protein [Streptomyces sp. NPDC006307]|uniref:ParB/RepB/Spo0J family partition protein n=1 Tax=Streptomyces sp. NPDC006307 TaxID=3156748 RepID=UPI0033B23203